MHVDPREGHDRVVAPTPIAPRDLAAPTISCRHSEVAEEKGTPRAIGTTASGVRSHDRAGSTIFGRIAGTLRGESRTVGFFLVVLLLMAPYLTLPPFVDETDNVLGARTIATGGVIYKDYFSQHTPLMYYIMAIPARFGVSSIAGFRIFFYVLIAGFFASLYYRYRSIVGTKALLVLPVLFTLDIARNSMMGTILSDMIQAMALLVLYLEYFVYSTTKPDRLKPSSTIAIALALFVAVGTAFMSVYPIAIVLLGVVLTEVARMRSREVTEHRRWTFGVSAIRLVRRFSLLAATMMTLGVLYAGYFAMHHALRAMLYQSYTFNTVVYSKYVGTGSSPVGTLLAAVSSYSGYVTSSFSTLYTMSSFVSVLLILGNIGMCCYLFQRSRALTLVTALFPIFCGIRAYSGFHSTAYVMFSWFCIAYLLQQFVLSRKFQLRTAVACTFVAALAFLPSWGVGFQGLYGLSHAFDKKPNYYIQKYTPAGGYFYDSYLDVQTYIENNVRPASRVASGLVPWFADAFMPDVVADLETNKPNVVFYDANAKVWGHQYRDYSKPLEDLLARDYVYYPYSDAADSYSDSESSRVWIRKGIGVTQLYSRVIYSTTTVDAKMEPAGEIAGNASVVQSFNLPASEVNGVSVEFGTYARTNSSHITLEFGPVDATGAPGAPEARATISVDRVRDNSMHALRFDHSLSIPDGKYYIRLRSDDATPGNAVTVWLAQGKDAPQGSQLVVNGKPSAAELNYQVLQ